MFSEKILKSFFGNLQESFFVIPELHLFALLTFEQTQIFLEIIKI